MSYKPRSLFDAADCCCSIIEDLHAAVNDPHFKSCGVFDRKILNEAGESLPALPVPLAEDFRASRADALPAPLLGANNAEFGF